MSIYLTGWSYEYQGGVRDRDMFADGGFAGIVRSPVVTMKIEVQTDSTHDAERFKHVMETWIGTNSSDARSRRRANPDHLLEAFNMLLQLSEEDLNATITSMGVKLGSRGKVGSGG